MALFSVIVVTAAPAGLGSDAGGSFVKIDGRESLLRAVELYLNRDNIKQIQLVFDNIKLEEGKRKYGGPLRFFGVEVVGAAQQCVERPERAEGQMSQERPP